MDRLRPRSTLGSSGALNPIDAGDWGIDSVEGWHDCFELDPDKETLTDRDAQKSVPDAPEVVTFRNRTMWTKIGGEYHRVLFDAEMFRYLSRTSRAPFPWEEVEQAEDQDPA